MGADFIYAWSEVAEDKTALKDLVRYVSDAHIQGIFEDSGDADLIDEISMAEYRQELLDAIDRVHPDNFSDIPRDVGYTNINGTHIILTGGMSWGDIPTDSFYDVMRYSCVMELAKSPARMTAIEAVDALNLGG